MQNLKKNQKNYFFCSLCFWDEEDQKGNFRNINKSHILII